MIYQHLSFHLTVEYFKLNTHLKQLKIAGMLHCVICYYSVFNVIGILCFRTAIALRGSDGVVFAVEKLVTSKLHEDGTGKRLFSVENHIGMVYIERSI